MPLPAEGMNESLIVKKFMISSSLCSIPRVHNRHSGADINSGYKYPDPPGTLNYRETGGSNQVEVQIRVDEPSQHPRPSTAVATVRDKQSNLHSAKIIKTRSLHNKNDPEREGGKSN